MRKLIMKERMYFIRKIPYIKKIAVRKPYLLLSKWNSEIIYYLVIMEDYSFEDLNINKDWERIIEYGWEYL